MNSKCVINSYSVVDNALGFLLSNPFDLLSHFHFPFGTVFQLFSKVDGPLPLYQELHRSVLTNVRS